MSGTEELFQRIESDRFAALVNLASNLKTFLRALGAQPEVRELGAAMVSSEARFSVLSRVAELAGRPLEAGYEHPADSALAAYLWLLSRADARAGAAAAEKVEGCPQCWWAQKVAMLVRTAAPPAPDGNGVGPGGPSPQTAPAGIGNKSSPREGQT